MKKFITFCLLAAAFTALAANPPTKLVGGGTFTNCLVIASSPSKLYTVCGYSGATQYLMLFETNAIPTNGSICKLGPFPISAGQGYSIDLSYYGADLDKLVICNSTTTNILTRGNNDCTFQAIIAK